MSTHSARRLVAAAMAAATLLLAACDDGRSADLGTGAPASQAVDQDAAAVDAVAALETALQRREARAAVSLAAGGAARGELRRLTTNARRLDLEAVSLRYLADSATTISTAQRKRWGDAAWVVDVQVTWRYGGVDEASSVLTVPFVLRLQQDQVRVVTADLPQAERLPLWLDEEVQVARGSGAVAVTTRSHSAPQFQRYAQRAVRNVRASIPSWRGVLCVEVPADQASFRDVAGLPQQQAAAIAAATTTPDGSSAKNAPQHVYVNPRLFDPLEPEGRQIVVSHEAAHVALGAAMVDLPLWLSEGIADYVALSRSSTPVDRLAAQVLRLTRERGAPRRLPASPEFDGSDKHIGAHYEAAWLAVRLIADSYGEKTLWRFYRRAERDGGTAGAFRDVLGVTQAQFVHDWRSYLSRLAT